MKPLKPGGNGEMGITLKGVENVRAACTNNLISVPSQRELFFQKTPQ